MRSTQLTLTLPLLLAVGCAHQDQSPPPAYGRSNIPFQEPTATTVTQPTVPQPMMGRPDREPMGEARVPVSTDVNNSLGSSGISLISDPAAYRSCHYLPDSYAFIEQHTARSVWMPLGGAPNFQAIARLLVGFGSSALIVKDYVKSQKHYWDEACFIPRADDLPAVERVVRRFLELQATT